MKHFTLIVRTICLVICVSFMTAGCILNAKMSDADRKISDMILTQYSKDPHLSNRSLEVKSQDGRVRVRGVVNSYAEKKRALDIAASTPSVKGVTANIFLK